MGRRTVSCTCYAQSKPRVTKQRFSQIHKLCKGGLDERSILAIVTIWVEILLHIAALWVFDDVRFHFAAVRQVRGGGQLSEDVVDRAREEHRQQLRRCDATQPGPHGTS